MRFHPFRKKPSESLAFTLIDKTLQGLPLPDELVQASKDAFENPVALLDLRSNYDNLKRHPAWLHFLGRLIEIKSIYERAILMGERDRFGNDLSPQLRASYGTLMQILALPGQIETIQRESEAALIGITQDVDNDPWQP